MTFEQLIRKDLMDAVHAAIPSIALDGSGEPETCRVLITARDFDRDNPRVYRIGHVTSGSGDDATTTFRTAKVLADVRVEASLQVHATTQMDLEALFAALLARRHGVVWNWRGYQVRVEAELVRTRLVAVDPHVVETVVVTYSAPYFEIESAPVMTDASWFDGWTYQVEAA